MKADDVVTLSQRQERNELMRPKWLQSTIRSSHRVVKMEIVFFFAQRTSLTMKRKWRLQNVAHISMHMKRQPLNVIIGFYMLNIQRGKNGISMKRFIGVECGGYQSTDKSSWVYKASSLATQKHLRNRPFHLECEVKKTAWFFRRFMRGVDERICAKWELPQRIISLKHLWAHAGAPSSIFLFRICDCSWKWKSYFQSKRWYGLRWLFGIVHMVAST